MANRTFNYSDETLTQYASDQLSFLEEDLPDFEAFDPDLGTTKRDAMVDLVQWALSEGGDDINVSKLGDFTEQVLSEMNNSRRLFNQLRYWVMKAFPNRKAVQRQFGIGRFRKITGSQEAMVVFLNNLSSAIEEYRDELLAINTPAALLDGVPTQASALQAANNAQEKKKGNRMVDTESRIEQLNELHQHTKDYNTAAEYVYYDSPAKRDRYRPPTKATNVEVDGEGDMEEIL